jgi:hypothetical protein
MTVLGVLMSCLVRCWKWIAREYARETVDNNRGVALLFHAAEHVQQHVGQLLVTARLQLWFHRQTLSRPDPA